MIRSALALVLCLGLGGCLHSPNTANPGHRATLADNTQDFDRYVEQRTTSLLAMGASRDPADARAQATLDATGRYGPARRRGRERFDSSNSRIAPRCAARHRRPRPGREGALILTATRTQIWLRG